MSAAIRRERLVMNFGLLRNDFSEKPAFTAMKRLIALLGDPGPSFAPGSLSYSLQGAPSSARQLLLQKRDGSFYLVLSRNQVSAWDTTNLVDLDSPDPQITLQPGQQIERAEIFRPNDLSAPQSTFVKPSSIPISLSERVTVVRLVPSASQQPSPEPARNCNPLRPPNLFSAPAPENGSTDAGTEEGHGSSKPRSRRVLLRTVRGRAAESQPALSAGTSSKRRGLFCANCRSEDTHASAPEARAAGSWFAGSRPGLPRFELEALRQGGRSVSSRGFRFAAVEAVLQAYGVPRSQPAPPRLSSSGGAIRPGHVTIVAAYPCPPFR